MSNLEAEKSNSSPGGLELDSPSKTAMGPSPRPDTVVDLAPMPSAPTV